MNKLAAAAALCLMAALCCFADETDKNGGQSNFAGVGASIAASENGSQGEIASITASENGSQGEIASITASKNGSQGEIASITAFENGSQGEIASITAFENGSQGEIASITAFANASQGEIASITAIENGSQGENASKSASIDANEAVSQLNTLLLPFGGLINASNTTAILSSEHRLASGDFVLEELRREMKTEQKPDYFEVDPFAGTSYNALAQNLLSIRLRASRAVDFNRGMLARAAVLSLERQSIREAEYLSRLAFGSMLVSEAGVYIFSQLFETSCVIVCSASRFTAEQYGSEAGKASERHEARLEALKEIFALQNEIKTVFSSVIKELNNVLAEAEAKNHSLSGLQNSFALMRRANNERIQTIKSLNELTQALINQFNEHDAFRTSIMSYLEADACLPRVRQAFEISRIYFSCKDVLSFINRTNAEYNQISTRYDELLEARIKECLELKGLSAQQAARVRAFATLSERNLSPKKEPRLNALPQLEKMFELLNALSDKLNTLTGKTDKAKAKAKSEKELEALQETKDYLKNYFIRCLTQSNWPDNIEELPKAAVKADNFGIDNIDKYDSF